MRRVVGMFDLVCIYACTHIKKEVTILCVEYVARRTVCGFLIPALAWR